MKLSFTAIFAAALSLTMMGQPAMAASTTVSQVQMHCTMGGHVFAQPCVMVNRDLDNSKPMVNDTMNMKLAQPLMNHAQVFSVVYAYRARNSAAPSVNIERGDDSMMGDTFNNKTVYFWVTTHDGGRTWSKITTNETDTISG